ncbi:hypothetical protein JCM5296_001677 [Sporobolomyces johnsonii]
MAHELSVEGDKVVERDEHGNLIGEKDYSAVHRGYLAATHNPRVGPEAKHSAEKILHDLEAAHGEHGEGVDEEGKAQSTQPSGSPKSHKAALPHHKEKTQRGGGGDDDDGEGEVHRHRVIGGLKATLHRGDRSDEAKEHARETLREMGVPESEWA